MINYKLSTQLFCATWMMASYTRNLNSMNWLSEIQAMSTDIMMQAQGTGSLKNTSIERMSLWVSGPLWVCW